MKTILILGATASGKSALAHTIHEFLAKNGVDASVVNLDAFQIYRELNIGTAKPSLDERRRFHYRGLDLCSIQEQWDANLLASYAVQTCQGILNQGGVPICVGGSGLYTRAFLHGLDDMPPRNEGLRTQIRARASAEGWPNCHLWLSTLDPKRAKELHPNDKTRIERALEIVLSTGETMSEKQTKQNPIHAQTHQFPMFVIHKVCPQSALKESIFKRVSQLLEEGWMEEVRGLFQKYGDFLPSFHSFKAIGYSTILSALKNGKRSTPELVGDISTLTWQYAKRQMTWNRKEHADAYIENLDPDKFHEIYW